MEIPTTFEEEEGTPLLALHPSFVAARNNIMN
jgi:hypothetical protein